MSAGTDTKCEHSGGGALQIGDLRLLEDGGERSGPLGSDVVAAETASDGQSEDGERAGMSTGIDGKANTRGVKAHLSEDRSDDAPLERIAECSDAVCGEGTLDFFAIITLDFYVEAAKLVVIQAVKAWGWG